MQKEVNPLRAAAEALLRRMDELSDKLNSVTMIAQVHGCNPFGPDDNWTQERAALESALSTPTAEPVDERAVEAATIARHALGLTLAWWQSLPENGYRVKYHDEALAAIKDARVAYNLLNAALGRSGR